MTFSDELLLRLYYHSMYRLVRHTEMHHNMIEYHVPQFAHPKGDGGLMKMEIQTNNSLELILKLKIYCSILFISLCLCKKPKMAYSHDA